MGEVTRITYSVSTKGVEIGYNGTNYTIKNTDGDKIISRTELQAALSGQNLDDLPSSLLKIFSTIQGKSLIDIQHGLKEMASSNTSVDRVLKNKRNHEEAEKRIRKELKQQYNAIQKKKKEYEKQQKKVQKQKEEYNKRLEEQKKRQEELQQQQEEFQNRLLEFQKQQWAIQQQMATVPSSLGFFGNSLLSASFFDNLSMSMQYPAFGNNINLFDPMSMGLMSMPFDFSMPIMSYDTGAPINTGLEDLEEDLNSDIEDFNAKLQEFGITEEELLNNTGTINIELAPTDEVVIEEIPLDGDSIKTSSSKILDIFSKGSNNNEDPETQLNREKLKSRHIVDVYVTEIGDTVFDRDEVDAVKNDITKDNVLYVLSEFEKRIKDKNSSHWKRDDGNPYTLWDAIKDEYSTASYKYSMFKPIVDAMLERAEELGVDIYEDEDLIGLKNALDDEYLKPWYRDTDEAYVQRKFDAAYARLLELENQD